MMWQRSPGMRPEISKDGCYLMSIYWHVAKRNVEMVNEIHDISTVLYAELVARGFMRDDCYILDPAAIFGYLGMDVKYLGKFGPERVCGDDEIEINLWYYGAKDWYHFVAGNGFGFTEYDPWGISTTATHGKLKSKRIFRIE